MNKKIFEIHRQERETNQSLIRRFSRRLKESGILTNAKKHQFRARAKSAGMKKRAALRKIQVQKEYEKARKLGQKP